MANGPEPKDRNTGSTPSSSADDQLKAFRANLDRTAYEREFVTKVVPGFLFRDKQERRASILRPRLENDSLFSYWRAIDENLIAQHVETYRRGIEARDLLLQRIKPADILEVVRDVWGKGEIEQTEGEATLTYPYLSPEEEWDVGHHTFPASSPSVGNPNPTSLSIPYSYKSGMWFAWGLEVREKVSVEFGYAKAPAPRIEECFADDPYKDKVPWLVSHLAEHFKVPKTIWQRPDNLGIYVTLPYMLQKKDRPRKDYLYGYFQRIEAITWFDPTTPQQDIMDYLRQRLEEQRRVGQLPPQVEALELAKIEELRRRGLFDEGTTIIPTYGL